jgi:hypothetical protein
MCIEKEIYKDTKNCLLGCGSSLNLKKINFEDYDNIIGINRIHQTKYFKYINILYDSAHYLFDPITNIKVNKLNESNLKYYFAIPGSIGLAKVKYQRAIFDKIKITKKIYENRSDTRVDGKKILSGLFVLNIIISGEPKSIDIYGFDFYKENYIEDLSFKHDLKKINEMHNLEREELYLKRVMDKNKNINWIR